MNAFIFIMIYDYLYLTCLRTFVFLFVYERLYFYLFLKFVFLLVYEGLYFYLLVNACILTRFDSAYLTTSTDTCNIYLHGDNSYFKELEIARKFCESASLFTRHLLLSWLLWQIFSAPLSVFKCFCKLWVIWKINKQINESMIKRLFNLIY